MLLLKSLIAFAVLWEAAVSTPLEQLASRKKFTLQQVAVTRQKPWMGPNSMRRAYLKYGVKVPGYVEEAVKNVEAGPPGQTSIGVRPVKGDVEFLVAVQVGNHNLSLDLDTGSSDLWVFSTLQPNDQRSNRPVNRVYDPKGSSAKQLAGHSWQIRYGDMSGASGQVYIDKVAVGELSVPNQAVEAAITVSRTFTRDNANDGLIGLAFSKLNTVKPTAQKTWFDNIRPMLAAPVFTSALKRRQVGTYDFGFIDKSKYKGDIHWVNVKGAKGFWDFQPTAYQVGDKAEKAETINAIADTGTSLWYLPARVANAYWAAVPGASYNNLQAGFTFPCASKLPDLSLTISGKKVVVPGINMNYQTISQTTCYGGIQRDSGMPFSIFGDVFLKGMFVAFEAPIGGQARIGFAPQSLPNS